MKTFFMTLLCLLCLPAFAQEDGDGLSVKVKGFVDTYHAMRVSSPNDWMSSHTRIRGELTLEKDNSGLFASTNIVWNPILESESGFFLREAYLYYTPSEWDIRAGRQIITWGVADALRLTDIISPMDYTEFLAEDYDDIRVPVNALRVRYVQSGWSAEAVVVPVCSWFTLPLNPENPWSVSLPGVNIPYSVYLSGTPDKKLKNLEVGGRFSAYSNGIDFSLCALLTWNKMPVIKKTLLAGPELVCTGEYRRMTMVGGDVSIPFGQFVFRGEVAEYFNEAQDPATGMDVVRKNSTNALAGLDWFGPAEWSAGVQYSHKYVAGNLSGTSVFRNSGMATVRISKDLLRSTLKLSTFAYIDVTNGGVFNRLSADYAVTDTIHAIVGYDLLQADSGMFLMYDKNSEIWVKLKYSF